MKQFPKTDKGVTDCEYSMIVFYPEEWRKNLKKLCKKRPKKYKDRRKKSPRASKEGVPL